MVNLENVSKFIIQGMSLHIPAGACVGLIGASGAGKTTLLKLICGLLQPDAGYVRTLGKEPVAQHGRYGRDMSVFLVGRSALENGDTVKQSFSLVQSIYGLEKEQFWQEYEELAASFGFEEYAEQSLKSLSLGQCMRVELSMALIGNPKLILLDEPNVGLDENGKEILWGLIGKRCQEGAAVLVASHSLSDIAKVCDRIVFLEKGQLLYYGSEKNLRSKYASLERMELKLIGKLPDLEDLPLQGYELEGDRLCLNYDTRFASAAEVLGLVLKQSRVAEVNIRRPDLEDIVVLMQERMKSDSGV